MKPFGVFGLFKVLRWGSGLVGCAPGRGTSAPEAFSMGFSASGLMIRIGRVDVGGVGSGSGGSLGVEGSYGSDLRHFWSDAWRGDFDGISCLGRAEGRSGCCPLGT